ncbi:MAG: RNA methyltransferase [Lachnospiraceae bacterium]|nr:RNA methyltransferase [Lachnospiraceae bacterium]
MNLIKIDNLHIEELKMYIACNEKELLHYNAPKDYGIFIAESPKVIERALDAGYEPISLLVEKRQIEGEARGVIERLGDIPIYTADFDVLTGITGFELTRGALCAMRRKKLPTVDEICEGASRIVVLDGVVNPTNVGAIIRSAAALGIDSVLLTPDCADPLYRRAIRVSMGTVFQIGWSIFDYSYYNDEYRDFDATDTKTKLCKPKENNMDKSGYINKLKKIGFTTVAMALKDNSIGIDDECLSGADMLAIIMGTEGEGLSDDVIKACDYTAMIPMSHGVDSLNVAAASAVTFWELGKRI